MVREHARWGNAHKIYRPPNTKLRGGEYIATPPPSPPVRGLLAAESNNLMSHFVNMEDRSYGDVMDLEQAAEQWAESDVT